MTGHPLPREDRLTTPSILAAGLLISAIGLSVLVGWLLQIPALTSWKSGLIPMSPVAAVLTSLLGATLAMRSQVLPAKWSRPIAIALTLVVGSVSAALLLLRVSGVYSPLELLGFPISGTVRGVAVGYISWLTAACFVLASVALLAELTDDAIDSWRQWVAMISAAVVTGAGTGLLLVNLAGANVLYGGARVPPSINAAVTLLLIGLAELGLARRIGSALDHVALRLNQGRLRLTAFFVAFVIAAVIGAAALYQQESINVRDKAADELSTISQLRLRSVQTWRQERFWDANQFFRNSALSELVRTFLNAPVGLPPSSTLTNWLQRYPAHAEYDAIALLDTHGALRLSLPARATGGWITADMKTAALDALSSGTVRLRDFFWDDTLQRPTLALVIPVLGEAVTAEPVGILILRTNPEPSLYPILAGWPSHSTTAETLLVRRDGDNVLFLSNLRFDAHAALQRRVPLQRTDVLSVKAVNGSRGLLEGLDYRDASVLGVVQPVPDSPWFLVSRVDLSEIQADVRDRLWLIVAFVSVLIFGAGTGLSVVWRRQRETFALEQVALTSALRESEERLRLAVAASELGLWDLNVETGEVVVSPQYATMLGFDPKTFHETVAARDGRIHPDDIAAMRALLEDYLSGRRAEYRGEFREATRAGSYKWMASIGRVVSRSADGRPLRMLGTIADIGDRKFAEATLRHSEASLRSVAAQLQRLLQDSPTVMYTMRVINGELTPVSVTENLDRLFGYTPEEGLEAGWWSSRLVDDDRANVLKAQQQLATRDELTYEFRFLKKDGTTCWVQDTLRVLERSDAGHPTQVVGAWTDVTARKAAELRAQRVAQLYEALSETNESIVRSSSEAELFPRVCQAAVEKGGMAMTWIGMVDQATGLVKPLASAGAGTEYLNGLRVSVTQDDPFGQGPTGLAVRENRPVWSEDFSADPKTAPWHARGRSFGWAASGSLPLTRHGRPVGALTIYMRSGQLLDDQSRSLLIEMAANISYALDNFAREIQRASAEAKVMESEQRYRTIFAESNLPMLLIEPDTGQIQDANDAATQFYGWSLFTMRQMNIGAINTLSPESIRAEMALVLSGQKRHFDFRHRLESGEIRDVEVFSGMIRGGDSKLLLSTVIDVTSRLRAEAALRDSEHLLSESQRIAHVGSWVEHDQEQATWSSEMFHLFGLQPRAAAPPFAQLLALVHRDDRAALQQHHAQLWSGASPHDVEFRIVRRDSTVRDVSLRGELNHTSVGRAYMTGTVQDITERKEAERTLRTALHEQEVLLKEVHHRVKNNLQLITSLLRLEAGRTDNAATQAVLGEMQGRILSMALLHETLYRAGSLAFIDLGGYLEQLANQLFRSAAPSSGVALRLDLTPAAVELDQAIPCGLIVNELLSNSLKHGFPDGRRGATFVRLHRLETGTGLRLEVGDDGVGLPADLRERESNSLGLHLVSILAKQLGGTLTIGEPPGTLFTLLFTPKLLPTAPTR